MNKYVVAYISLFENELKQKVIYTTSKRAAILEYLASNEDINFTEEELLSMETVESLTIQMYDMDSHISVIEI